MKRAGLAKVLLVAALTFFVLGMVGTVATLGVDRGNEEQSWVGVVFGLVNLAFASSGYVIARRTGNPLGWLLLGLALVTNLGGAADGYALYGLIKEPGSLPAPEWAGWIADFVISGAGLLFGTFIFVFLLFPEGKLPVGRWRIVAWTGALGAVLAQINVAFSPGPLPGFPQTRNPLGSPGMQGLLDLTEPLSLVLILPSLVAAVASMAVRYRRSSAEQRQQMKWVGAAGGLLALVIVSGPIWWTTAPSFGNVAWPLLFATGLAGIPISIAVSVLKYRLYEIDLVINKTLVYVALTAILAGCYLGSIVLLQQVLPVGRDSDLAVAASTLAVAGLFRPLRARVQGFIDRRFYRRRYDAAETLGAFSSRLRDEVDIESLRTEIVDVVRETMQPAHASLWLRTGAAE